MSKYYIVKVDGKMRMPISNDGNAYYGGNDLIGTKYFKTIRSAAEWIVKHSYPYMSHHYEIKKEDD